MVKFAPLIVAIMAAISGTSAAVAAPPPFKQACTFPYDVCGWTLTDGVRAYDVEVLRAAAKAAGQTVDPNGDQTLLYDAIYNCQAGGAIAWNRYCGKGKCDAGLQVPNANCRA
ncbi:hypothetical protein NKR19_g5236 [Coniochaeta hoffmannii]|uniref:Uncharacterized protein n=1 Tax=Coniochaeta hoffmannii TaxID=91930 RepID=A0AA38VT91_9PEZI|nr:hypothetical protein NKR19_g5236 [Coniochaeta hoffmannii]